MYISVPGENRRIPSPHLFAHPAVKGSQIYVLYPLLNHGFWGVFHIRGSGFELKGGCPDVGYLYPVIHEAW